MTPKCIMHCLMYVFLSYALTISYFICIGDQIAPWWWFLNVLSLFSRKSTGFLQLLLVHDFLTSHRTSTFKHSKCIFLTHHIIIHMIYTVEMIFLSMHFIFVLSSRRAEPCKAYSRFSDAQSHVLTSQIAKLLATECLMFIASAR